jgi:signal peptidase I
MARRPADEDPDDDSDLDDDEDEAPKPRSTRRPRPRGRPAPTRGPVRRWRPAEDSDEEEEPPRKPPVYWRARDSLYFEPLVALAIVIVLVAGMYAYTQNWPPVYVIESDSMQHGPNDVLGVINTGDLVLAQKTSFGSIVDYIEGLRTGFSTYGEYGDVLLYHPNGGGSTPIIHRAIVYLEYNPNGSYDVPELAGLPCGNASNAVYSTPGTDSSAGANCGTTDLTGTLDLYRIGWNPVNVSISFASPGLGDHSGFLTMGDNNIVCTGSNCLGAPDQVQGFSTLVEPGWIIGVARGMIPWFGALKLALEGNAGEVPAQSWQFLGLTVAGAILLAFGIHYALRAEGIEDPRRKAEEERDREEAEDDEDEEDDERPRRSRFLGALRPWRVADDEEDDEAPPPRRSRRVKPKPTPPPSRRGRPRPRVRRSEKTKAAVRRPHDEEDEDL